MAEVSGTVVPRSDSERKQTVPGVHVKRWGRAFTNSSVAEHHLRLRRIVRDTKASKLSVAVVGSGMDATPCTYTVPVSWS